MAKSSPLLTARSRERKKKKILRWALFLCFLLVIAFVGLVFLARAPQLRISSFDVSGTSPADDAAIRSAVAEAASGDYLVFFPKSDIFLYPAAKTEEGLLAQFPEIRSVSISRAGVSGLKIAVDEKKPGSLWCGDSPDAPRSPCLFLDDSGEAYKEAPVFSSPLYFEYFGELATSTLPAAFLPLPEFRSLNSLIASLSGIFDPVSAYMTPEGDIDLSNASGTIAKIAVQKDYSQTIAYFKAFLAAPALGSASVNPDTFEYIDLRFGKKIYYKLKAPIITAAASSSPAIHN